MRIKYLGTAAAEGWPGLFCHCPACEEARRRGGKNLRHRAQALINDDMMVDLNCDNYSQSLAYGIDLAKIRWMPVTHSHADHFILWDLENRGGCYTHNAPLPDLEMFTNHVVHNTYEELSGRYFDKIVKDHIHCRYCPPYIPVTAGPYRITPLLARHKKTEDCYIYIFEEGGKSILYGNDTGLFPDETMDYLASLQGKLVFDLVSLDCTCGPRKEGTNHMGIPDDRIMKERLLSMGLADDHTRFVLTHFSHNGGLLYEELTETVKDDGFIIAYDGMEMEL